MTARQQQQNSIAGRISIFDSTIGDEEFSFDDEIITSYAYRRVIKDVMFRARGQQHQDGQSAEIEDGQNPSRFKNEPTNMQQDRTLSPVSNSGKGGGMEEEQRILEERFVKLKNRASPVQEQQDELRKLQEQLQQPESQASQTSSQQPKQSSEDVRPWGRWNKDNLPVTDHGHEDSMLLTPGFTDSIEDSSLSSDKQTSDKGFAHQTDRGVNTTLKHAPGIPIDDGDSWTTAYEILQMSSEPSLPLESSKKSAKSWRNDEYHDLDETADGDEPKNEEVNETADGVQMLISGYGSFKILRSQNAAIFRRDFGDGILQMMPSKPPTIEMQNFPVSVESSVQWLVSPEPFTFTGVISSTPPPLKVVLLGSMCGKTSAFLTYATQNSVLVSYLEITVYKEYHINVPLIFQGRSEDVEVTVFDTGDSLSWSVLELDARMPTR